MVLSEPTRELSPSTRRSTPVTHDSTSGVKQLDDRMKKRACPCIRRSAGAQDDGLGTVTGAERRKPSIIWPTGWRTPNPPRAKAGPTSCISTSRSKASPRQPTGTSRTWSHSECQPVQRWVNKLVSSGKTSRTRRSSKLTSDPNLATGVRPFARNAATLASTHGVG